MTSRWRPIATTIVCLAGLGLAAFLTWGHYFDQKLINTTCPAGGTSSLVNCGLVTTSPESMIFHVPVALYGLLFFVAMTALCLPVAWRSSSARIAQVRLGLNVVGMGFVLYLVSVEFLELHHICLYCTGVHILQFALFLLVVTGWNDTGYVQAQWADYDEDEELSYDDEGLDAGTSVPSISAPPGHRLPRSLRSKNSVAASR